MGDKINARAEMIRANVPVIPGSDAEVDYGLSAADKDSDRRCAFYRYGEGRHHFTTTASSIRTVHCFVC